MDASIRKSKYDDNSLQSTTKSTLPTSEARDFLSAVSMLDDVAERYALRVLIQKNTALARKTIWQYIIVSTGLQYSDLIKKLLEEGMPIRPKMDKAKDLKQKIRALASYTSDFQKLSLLLFYMDDFEAVKNGLTPMSLTHKAEIIAMALRTLGISIPSLDATDRALRRLVDMGFVLERKIEGKHADRLYYVNPDLFVLWEKQKQVTTKPKTESEKFWFG
jgi:hypothetical protein